MPGRMLQSAAKQYDRKNLHIRCAGDTGSTDGEVANALVCKTSIHGFKSHSVLQYKHALPTSFYRVHVLNKPASNQMFSSRTKVDGSIMVHCIVPSVSACGCHSFRLLRFSSQPRCSSRAVRSFELSLNPYVASVPSSARIRLLGTEVVLSSSVECLCDPAGDPPGIFFDGANECCKVSAPSGVLPIPLLRQEATP